MEKIPLTLLDLPGLLSHIPNHDREVWYRVGMGVKAEFGDAGREAWQDWSATDPSFNKRDAADTWKSFGGGGVGLGTVIKLAKDNGWTPAKRDMTPAERKQFREQQEAQRAARQAEVEADEAKKERMRLVVSEACGRIWTYRAVTRGESAYLTRKGVPGLAQIGYFDQSVVLFVDDQEEKAGVLTGGKVMEFFRKLPDPRPVHISFLRFPRGSICVPVMGPDGRIWSLQMINGNGTKLFPKYGRKAGCFHVLGDPADGDVIAFAEGLATAASIRMATGWPVVIAFTAENLPKVAAEVRKLNPDARFVFCADRDEKQAGEKFAKQAAGLAGNALVVLPDFGEAA